MLAVPVDLPLLDARGRPTRPDQLLAGLSKAVWERRSCGEGTKGERCYDWTAVAVQVKDQPAGDGHTHTLLVRRSVGKPTEIEYF
ncbi:MAG: IS701 family transposase, partial [Pseudonocardia sp.]